MLAVWQAADDIDVYESGWTFDHFYGLGSRAAHTRCAGTAGGGDPGFRLTDQQSRLTVTKI